MGEGRTEFVGGKGEEPDWNLETRKTQTLKEASE